MSVFIDPRLPALTLVVLAMFAPLPARAAAVGSAVAVAPAAQSEGPRGAIILAKGVEVNAFERVRTSVDGAVTLKFRDDSILEIGPGSLVSIDSFVYNGDGTASEAAITMTRGAFRWASGRSAKEAYKLKTPSATLGIRGTVFTVLADQRSTTIQLTSGAVRACNPATGRCGEITRAGQGVRLFLDGRIEPVQPGGVPPQLQRMRELLGHAHRGGPPGQPPLPPGAQGAGRQATQQPANTVRQQDQNQPAQQQGQSRPPARQAGVLSAGAPQRAAQVSANLPRQSWSGTWTPKGPDALGPKSPDALSPLSLPVGATQHQAGMRNMQSGAPRSPHFGPGGPGGFQPGGGPMLQPPRPPQPGVVERSGPTVPNVTLMP